MQNDEILNNFSKIIRAGIQPDFQRFLEVEFMPLKQILSNPI